MEFLVKQIGTLHTNEERFWIELFPEYIPLVEGLDGFSNVQILWWFDQCDNDSSRAKCTVEKPYVNGPETLGIFATRSPQRPNPIALSSAYVTGIDQEKGCIELAYLDAFEGSPVLDIKPYTPSLDRVEHPVVPDWCAQWPGSVEASGEFDWGSVFTWEQDS